MVSKEEVVRICKQHGLSAHDAKKEFEKIDIDNDGEMPRNSLFAQFSHFFVFRSNELKSPAGL
jgi:Ca2+-binding EF-hand superfamily protein